MGTGLKALDGYCVATLFISISTGEKSVEIGESCSTENLRIEPWRHSSPCEYVKFWESLVWGDGKSVSMMLFAQALQGGGSRGRAEEPGPLANMGVST